MKTLTRKGLTTGLIVALMTLMSACATPPTELVEARDAYETAKTSPAMTNAPADVKAAEEALMAAEVAFDDKGDDEVTRALAYRALRKAQIAMVNADIYVATQAAEKGQARLLSEGEEARKTLATQLDKRESELAEAAQLRAMTQAELEEERTHLEKLQADFQAQVVAGELTEQQLAARQQELAVAKTELENERKQREAAEQRLKEVRAELEKVAQIKEDARRLVITLTGEVLFELGKSALLPTAQRRLDQVSEMLLAHRDATIVVEGHTDSQGSDEANRELSLQRAQSVTTYLQSKGIAGDRLTAVGKGETMPVATNDTPAGRANNRRVEIIVNKLPEPASASLSTTR